MMTMEDNTTVNTTAIGVDIEIPVIFYDGEREIDLGKVDITPTMTFKLLQSTLSNKIGISPNHITIYFDRSNIESHHLNHHHHHRRRHPVTSKFDFSSVEPGSCFLWVVLKRGRRNRRRRNGKNDAAAAESGGPFVLLRRGVNVNDTDWDYINRLRMFAQLERDRERYFMSLNLNSNVYNELSGYGINNLNDHNPNFNYNYNRNYGGGGGGGGGGGMSVLSRSSGDDFDFDADLASCSTSTGGASSERVFCDVCYNSPPAADTVPFHWCKNDAVVSAGFRSIVGPIAPPWKNRLLG